MTEALSRLSNIGWGVLLLAVVLTFGFVVNLAKREYGYASTGGLIAAVLWVLVLWAVTP